MTPTPPERGTASVTRRPDQERQPRSALARHYGSVLKRQAWLIGLITGCAVAGAAAISALQTPVSRASMKVVVGQGNGFFQPQFGSSVQPFTQTMTALLESDIVARRVIKARALATTPRGLLSDLHVASNPESSVLEVSYDSTDKKTAVTVLQEIGTTFATLVKDRFGSQKANAGQPITATVFDPAHLEPGTVSPRPARNAVLAAILGLLLGGTAAFLRDALDERVRSSEDAEAWLNAPVVGVIPRLPRRHLSLVQRHNFEHATLEAVYRLRANLEFSDAGPAGNLIVVTSAVPDEGKTTLVARLSSVLAVSGKSVVCVDADLRRPKLADYLGADQTEGGLVEVLTSGTKVSEVVASVTLPYFNRSGLLPAFSATLAPRWAGSNPFLAGCLRIVPHGSIPARPAEVFQSGSVESLMAELRGMADYIIFDTSPILVAADAFPLVRAADTVLVTVREGLTKRDAAEAAAATLDGLGVRNRFAVLNASSSLASYGYYVYGAAQPPESPRFRIIESANREGETVP